MFSQRCLRLHKVGKWSLVNMMKQEWYIKISIPWDSIRMLERDDLP